MLLLKRRYLFVPVNIVIFVPSNSKNIPFPLLLEFIQISLPCTGALNQIKSFLRDPSHFNIHGNKITDQYNGNLDNCFFYFYYLDNLNIAKKKHPPGCERIGVLYTYNVVHNKNTFKKMKRIQLKEKLGRINKKIIHPRIRIPNLQLVPCTSHMVCEIQQ